MAQKQKYDPAFVERLPGMFANGESVAEVAAALGVSRRAFYDWVEQYPEFKTAYEDGKQLSEAWWTKLGRAGAAGKVDIQPTVWIFNMKNRFEWRDKVEQDNISSDGSMSPKGLTPEQQKMLDKLTDEQY